MGLLSFKGGGRVGLSGKVGLMHKPFTSARMSSNVMNHKWDEFGEYQASPVTSLDHTIWHYWASWPYTGIMRAAELRLQS